MKRMILTLIFSLIGIAALAARGQNEFLTYAHQAPAFSFKYPRGFVPEPLQAPSEVARFAAANQFKNPALIANIFTPPRDFELTDLAEFYIGNFTKMFPASSGHKIIKEQPVKLNDGTEAQLFTLTLIWVDGQTPLEIGGVGTMQGDKLILVQSVVLSGLAPLTDYLGLCMTLTLED